MDGEKWGEERKVDKRAEKVLTKERSRKKGDNRNGNGKEKRRKERRR